MGRYRDDELGTLLRELETPEHRQGFEEELMALLDAPAGRANPEAGPTPAATAPERSPREVEDPRRPTARDRRAQASRRRTWWQRFGWVPIPAVAAALLIVWALGGFGSGALGPRMASAAEVKAKVASALAAVDRMRGILVVVAREKDAHGADIQTEMRWSFSTTSRGDLRLTGLSRKEDLAYDAGQGVERVTSGGEVGQPLVASEARGLAAGPPDPSAADWVLRRNLGAVVRALSAGSDPSVTETTFQGRPAWILVTTVQRNRLSGDLPGSDHLEVTVDQATGFPVRIVRSRDGALVEETRIEGLELDPDLPVDLFTLKFPDGVDVGTFDKGFRRVTLPQVASIVGYEPLLPTDLPAGYEPTDITVAAEGQATGKEGMNPDSRGVVSLAFRRGLDRIVVSTRLVGDDPARWTDPLASGEGYVDAPKAVVLRGGAFDGTEAEVLVDPLVAPHLWARNDTLVLTVSGDASEAELLRIAQSLRPRSGG